ncbi:MAG: class I SAM-dependent methyltransferase [Parachlamydiales bacterium]|nr:class I SAM-dependent methyltransferase [Parachlamydiales bacterium]
MIYPDTLQDAEAVAKHYDSLDSWYRKLWGDHVHHGLWLTGKESPEKAVIQLIELIAERGAIKKGQSVCDIGCGYGGTARFLHQKWGANVTGFSLSEKQLEYARQLDPHTRYILCDWLQNSLPANHFDLAISVESSEHMVDKPKFFQEAHRVLKPNGKLVICAWLSKENPSPWEVRHLLEPICREGRLPSLGSVSDYTQMMMQAGFKNVEYEDLTSQVKKTWSICALRLIKELKNREFRDFLFKRKPADRIFAKTIFRILFAYQTRSMIYGIFRTQK